MLVKLSGENFLISLSFDEAAMIVEDLARHVRKYDHDEATWNFAERLNHLWWLQESHSMGTAIERLVDLEEG